MQANTTMVSKNILYENIFAAIGSFLLFFLILFSALNYAIFNKNFYEDEFQKLGIYEKFGKDTADTQRDALLDYFNNKDDIVRSDFFNEREKQHLVDVKNLIILSKIIFYSLFIVLTALVVFIMITRREIIRFFKRTFFTTSIMIFVLFVLVFLFKDRFAELFYDFHLLFFNNQLWLLNPATDNLINLFPQQFFYDIAARISLMVFVFGSLLAAISSTLYFSEHQKL